MYNIFTFEIMQASFFNLYIYVYIYIYLLRWLLQVLTTIHSAGHNGGWLSGRGECECGEVEALFGCFSSH